MRHDLRMPLSPGTQLGPYEVLALIGAGGMGEVYRARDPRLNRDVAIKVLPAERVADEGRRRRFVQEAQAASALNHPHIVTIHEIESADGRDFIVMELVRGKSLDTLIPRNGMRLSEVVRIAIPVADALAAAHAHGIVHRDLKPANVMVGQDGAVKVLDFGLAKLLSGEATPEDDTVSVAANVGLSAPGTIAGTAAYMSPEQASGAKVDARSDIFSFGAMLYEMVTGHARIRGHVDGRHVERCDARAAEGTERDCAGHPERPGEGHRAMPAQGPGSPVPAHRRCEGRAAGDQGGLRVWQHLRGRTATPSRPSHRRARWCPDSHRRRRARGCDGTIALLESPPMRVVPLTTLPGHRRESDVLAGRRTGGVRLGAARSRTTRIFT